MTESQAITIEEKDQLASIKSAEDQTVISLGACEYSLNKLNMQKKETIIRIATIQKEKTKLFKQLQDKYGQGEINIDTGEFTPSK